MSFLEMCPQFRGVLIEGFHCIAVERETRQRECMYVTDLEMNMAAIMGIQP